MTLTRTELAAASDSLAAAIVDRYPNNRQPVVVYGHKHPHLLVCFLACVKAGHAYVPVDSSLPEDRVAAIVAAAEPVAVFAPEDPTGLPETEVEVWSGAELESAMARHTAAPDGVAVRPDEPFYIIFTSGSTGTPKGVQISRSAVNNFTNWITAVEEKARLRSPPQPRTIINQAPFSFDLSVMDLMISLATGTTLFSLDRDHIASLKDLFAALAESAATSWVSTPSFADLCLAVPEFSAELLPDLTTFLFCGEALPHATAAELRRRFPGAAVVNTYGPTESTVAVTDVVVDEDILARFPILPVGKARPGTRLLIVGPDAEPMPAGQQGEIVIAGDTVALGYHHRSGLTRKSFGDVTVDGETLWSYRTGDAGVLDEEGYLHFRGRLDFQVKMHGYRIEIEDIEAHLRALEGIHHAVVLPRYGSDGTTVTSLHAVVQPQQMPQGSRLAAVVALKGELKSRLPEYMIPRTIDFTPSMPLTANGKADRAAVAAAHPAPGQGRGTSAAAAGGTGTNVSGGRA